MNSAKAVRAKIAQSFVCCLANLLSSATLQLAQEPEGHSAIYLLIQDSWPDEPKEITVDGQAKTVLDLGGYCIVSSLGEALAELALVRKQLAEQ